MDVPHYIAEWVRDRDMKTVVEATELADKHLHNQECWEDQAKRAHHRTDSQDNSWNLTLEAQTTSGDT